MVLTRKLLVLLSGILFLGVVALPAQAARPGSIYSCNQTGQYANVDPIVSPGVTSAHEHAFFGARDIQTVESTAKLRTQATSCVETANHSGYWMPSVYRNGVRLQPATSRHMLAYYRCVTSNCAGVPSFPDDLKLVQGNSAATTAAQNPAFNNGLGGWRCGTGGGAFSPMPPANCDARVLVASVTFPDQHGLRVQLYFRWQLPSNVVGTITLGDIEASPLTLHADYFFGWERAAFDRFMDQCIHASRDCGTNFNV